MSNLIVYIEVRGSEPTAPALFALSEARRVSRELGASVYALLTVGTLSAGDLDTLVGRLGVGGADKVLLCQDGTLGGAPLDSTHGLAVAAAAERVPPALFMLPAGAVGPELGPRLAARIGGAYAPSADIEIVTPPPTSDGAEASPRLTLRRWRGSRDGTRRLDPDELERPVVTSLRSGPVPEGTGTDDIEVEIIAVPEAKGPAVTELSSEPDEGGALEMASGVVVLPAGMSAAHAGDILAAAPAGFVVADADAPAVSQESACPSVIVSLVPGHGGWGAAPRTRLVVAEGIAPADVAPAIAAARGAS